MYPFVKLVLPTALTAHKNGQLPTNLLAPIKTGGVMYTPVADYFNKLYDAALAAGIKLKNIGDYRSFDGQLKMFLDRYSTSDLGRKPQVTRQYEGKTWYLKPGKAPSAAPDPTGKKGSNHGWGLAIDLGFEKGGKTVALSSDKTVHDWMVANAPKFGFYLQGSDPNSKEFEFWHWQYALGDNTPDGAGQMAPDPSKTPSNALNPPSGTRMLVYPGSPVRRGSRGVSVELVQAAVGAKPDGDFGPATERRVIDWQRANGLKPDGIVGEVTWNRMFP